MLRRALPLSRNACERSIGFRVNSRPSRALFSSSKSKDPNTKPSIHDSDAVVLPGSQSTSKTAPAPPAPGPVASISPSIPTTATPSENKVIAPESVPRVPPPPPRAKVQISPPTSIPKPASRGSIPPTPPPTETTEPASPPPPPPRRKGGRLRRFLLYLLFLGGLSYAGGVYYSLVSDNFHDFFTEYVPFGEDAVLYFEEREFRKRFPRMTNPTNRPPPDSGNKITIPSRSGVSWKISEESNKGAQARSSHINTVDDRKPPAIQTVQQTPSVAIHAEKTNSVESAKKAASPQNTADSPKTEAPNPATETGKNVVTPKPEPSVITREALGKKPEVNEPSIPKIIPIDRIDPINIKNADEPLVQDLVKILNDIITVINADNASAKYSSTIGKAKSELAIVGQRILDLKKLERLEAQRKIRTTELEFDSAAQELVRRLEEEMKTQESRWQEEFELERETISQSYQERLKNELKRSEHISEQRLRNSLLEQAIELKKKFIDEVKDRVEAERNGRLSKLSDLSSSVNELEFLTTQWNSVLDANLKTQHLQVAVEAVRASLEQADRPRPFVHELATLKELARDNPVVNAAIASINPSAYQRGIPTSAELIERFRRVAAEVRKAALLPVEEDAGVAAHAVSNVLSRFIFKKQKGRVDGDDVESVLARTETLLEEGKLDDAAREMNVLEGWAKTLSADWIAEARKVLEVKQAMDVMAAEVRLQALGVD